LESFSVFSQFESRCEAIFLAVFMRLPLNIVCRRGSHGKKFLDLSAYAIVNFHVSLRGVRGGEKDEYQEGREEVIRDLQMQSFLLRVFTGSFPRREEASSE